MGRKRTPDTWCVVKDVESGQLLKVEPTSQPSYFASTKYQLVGRFLDAADAEGFILFKQLDSPCDRLAYLEKEHSLREMTDACAQVDIEQLKEKSEALRVDTGRVCFGKCKSLTGHQACAICYSDLPKTWELCATTDILTRLLSQK